MTSLAALDAKLRQAGLTEAARGLQHAVDTFDPDGDFIGSLRHLNSMVAVCQRVYQEKLDAYLVPVDAVARPHAKMRPPEPEPPEVA